MYNYVVLNRTKDYTQMAFLKVQKLVKDGDTIVGSSVTIVGTAYVSRARYHAKHTILENLALLSKTASAIEF